MNAPSELPISEVVETTTTTKTQSVTTRTWMRWDGEASQGGLGFGEVQIIGPALIKSIETRGVNGSSVDAVHVKVGQFTVREEPGHGVISFGEGLPLADGEVLTIDFGAPSPANAKAWYFVTGVR